MTNSNNSDRIAVGKRCSTVSIFLNLFLFAIKLSASIISGSLSAIADAFNNLTDVAASVVSMIGFRFSEKHADNEHPYGHARAEYLSALIVAMIIILIGFEFIKTAIKNIISPTTLTLSPTVFFIMAFSIIIKVVMAIYNYVTGKRINSSVLIATSVDARNDAIMTTGIILGYGISSATNIYLDGYISLVLSVFIFAGGIALVKSTFDPLMGQAPDKRLVEYIRKKILSYPQVLGTHDLIIHDYGVGKRFASVHVEMSAELDVMESHDIIDSMERDFLKNDSINMIIHMDPIASDSDANPLRNTVTLIAKKIHPECSIHDLKIDNNIISFDCVKPEGCTATDDAIYTAFDVSLRLINPDYIVKVTIDSSFSPVIN